MRNICMQWLWLSAMIPLWALGRIHALRPVILVRPVPTLVLSSHHHGHDPPIQSSPATAAMREGDAVRRILKQRSTRGQPGQLLPPASPPNAATKKKNSTPKRTRKGQTSEKVRKLTRGEDARAKTSSPGKQKEQKTPAVNSKVSTAAAIKRTAQIITLAELPPAKESEEMSLPRTEISYKFIIEALRVYHRHHSHLVMPRKFIIDASVEKFGADFPIECNGLDLAGTVYDMKWWLRHVKQRPDRVAELNELGFVWERLQPEWNLILEALITYRSIHGDLLVPTKFVVPFGDSTWSRATWGVALGRSVYRIRTRGDFMRGEKAIKRRDQLDVLGFVWDIQEHRFDIFVRALRSFAQNEQTRRPGAALKIPSTFIIPSSKNYPEDLWGYPLGVKCTAVRQKELYVKGEPSRLKLLADIGFHIGGNDSLRWLEVVHAAAVYSQMNNRNLDVPLKFKVPAPPRVVTGENCKDSETCVVGSDDAWPWPEYLWGFPLGQRLRDIRVKGYYLRGDRADSRRRQLDALGFNWKPKRGRRKESP